MKRLILLIILMMLAFWVLKLDKRAHWSPSGPPRHHNETQYIQLDQPSNDSTVEAHKVARQARQEIRQAFHELRDEGRKAWSEIHHDLREMADDIRNEFHPATVDVADSAEDDDDAAPPVPPTPPVAEREQAEGIPVPIIPGTRVSEAKPQPPVPPRPKTAVTKAPKSTPKRPMPAVTTQRTIRTIDGLISADKARAEAQARRQLSEAVAAWLEPEVPRSWNPPAHLVNSLVLDTQFKPEDKPYGTMYVANLQYDASPDRRAKLVEVYNRQLVGKRLFTLGGSLSFILICLAAVSGYIRADEATRGYYTNRLRLLAAAGVGAAGVIIYQMIA
jgi:hypothetical protein